MSLDPLFLSNGVSVVQVKFLDGQYMLITCEQLSFLAGNAIKHP
jgi:hypothetical protein